ncbi:MAG: TetR family transcriptional regulator [Pseudomonadota bacterium]
MLTDTHRTPGRPQADAPAISREEIIEAALEAFAGQGFDGMSIRALARSLGVSHSLIHHYFTSKQALWEAGVEQVYGAVRDAAFALADSIDKDLPPADAARRFIREAVIISSRYPACLRIALDEGGRGGPRLQHLYENYFGPINERWKNAIAHFGEGESELNPVDDRALFFLCVFGGAAPFFARELAGYFDGDNLATRQATEKHAETVASMVVDGLRARAEETP